ncbi:MAG: discoidin domain-containing protein [Planctomycetes bacterium]|nr:discoidin domain-containing protein [Planctomycetota bacterium]
MADIQNRHQSRFGEKKSRSRSRAACILFFVPCLLPAHAEVAVTRDDTGFSVSSPVYQARIDGKTGLLEKMVIDGTTVIETTTIDLEGRPFAKTDVVQESPTRVTAYITAQEADGRLVEKALRLCTEAAESTLSLKVLSTVGRVSGRGPRFQLGKEVQMVRSLDFKETLPMPALLGRTPWLRVKLYYANGSTLGILNEGAGNPFNPNENGGVGGYQYARGGYVANSEYVYTLIAERGTKRTLGSPPMTIPEAGTPAVFWQGEPVQATLKIQKEHYQKLVGLSGLRVQFEVQDVFEKMAARGEAPLDLSAGSDIELKMPLPVTQLGWYRAYFMVQDGAGSLLKGRERLIFSLLKRQPSMGERFDNPIQTDYTIGLGFVRVSMDPSRVDEVERVVKERQKEAEGTDVNVSYQIDGSPVGNDPKRFGEVCSKLFERVKDGIPRVEIINEPNGQLQPKEYIETFLRPAYESIKKASPNTKVIGPVLCGISADQARYLEELYRLGLKGLTDELSFHPYAGNFDDGDATQSMERLMRIIAAHGDAHKPIHFTEAGYGHGGWSDLPSLREVIKHVVSQYAWQNAVMGIDHRHNFYYFTDQMGYYDMWLRSNQLTPAAVALRTYTGFVKGQGRAQQLDFGSLEAVRAFFYPGPQRQVVVMWTVGNWLPVDAADPTTEVSFKTNAKTVEWYDCFGNALPARAKRGTLKLSVGTYPSYLVLPAHARLEAVPERWGANVALASQGAIAESSSEEGTHPAISAIDGNTASGSSWRSLTPNELPQTLTVMLAGPTPISRAAIWSTGARGYTLEALGPGGKWLQLAARRDQPFQRFRTETFKALITDQVRLAVIDSHSDRAEAAELQVFSPKAKAGTDVELVNWALKSNGASARASSERRKEVTVAEQDWGVKQPRILKLLLEAKAENAIDGKRMMSSWREFFPTTWMAAADAAPPQWLEIAFPKARRLTSIAVYTIAFANWTPANSGIRAWDVQLWDGKDWKTVDRIADSERVSKITRLKTPTATEKLRIVVNATNDPQGTMGIMEVEAFGPRQ